MNNSIKQLLTLILMAVSMAAYAQTQDVANEYIQQGDQAFNYGQYKKALTNYQQATRYETDKVVLFVKIANTFFKLGDLDSALTVSNQVLAESPNNEGALLVKGQVLEGQANHDGALNIYLQVKQLNPDNSEVYYLQANVLRKMNRDGEASQIMDELTERPSKKSGKQKLNNVGSDQ